MPGLGGIGTTSVGGSTTVIVPTPDVVKSETVAIETTISKDVKIIFTNTSTVEITTTISRGTRLV